MQETEAVITSDLVPLVIYFLAIIAVAIIMLGGAYLLGQKHRPKAATDEPFESGIVPVGDVRIRFSVQFYLIAIFFVIFDMESVFLFAWSVSLQEAGWPGFAEACIFILVLVAALVYLWAVGALDWRTPRQRSSEPKEMQ